MKVLFRPLNMTIDWTIHDTEPKVVSSVPFLKDLINEETRYGLEGLHTVEVIILAKSGKGIMLKTEQFIYWLWTKDPASSAIKDHIDDIHGSNDLSSVLISVLWTTKELKIQIGIDTDGGRRWTIDPPGTYSQDLDDDYEPRSSSSPRPPTPRLDQPTPARKRRKTREPGGC